MSRRDDDTTPRPSEHSLFAFERNKKRVALINCRMRSIVARNGTRLAAAARGLLASPSQVVVCSTRSFAKLSAPGLDPLEVLRETSLKKGLCDQDGFRVAGVHWVFSVAVNAASPDTVS